MTDPRMSSPGDDRMWANVRGSPLDLPTPVEHPPPRAGRFLVAIAVALLGVAVVAHGLVTLLVAEREKSLHDALRARLEALAAGRAEVLATWLDGAARLGERLSRSELVRLYAYEAGLSQTNEFPREPLAEQMPYMQRLLDDFAAQHGLTGAAVIGRDGRLLLASSGPSPTAELRQRAIAAVEAGQRFTPVRTDLRGLVMDVVLPLAAPQPVIGDGRPELSGTLMMTMPVTAELAELLHRGAPHQPGERVHLLQAGDNALQRIVLDGTGGLEPLPTGIVTGGGAPLAYTRLAGTGDSEVLAVGAPVAGVPWTVLQALEATPALAPLRDFRAAATIVAALGALTLVLLIAALWWRQLGTHHRALAAQYQDLATRLHWQRQLLASVTGTVREMISLKGTDGRYLYVNPAFARMVGRPADAIAGCTDGELFDPALAAQLAEDDRRVMIGGASMTRDDELELSGRRHHLQTSRVPLRGEDGTITGVVTVVRDVTELVEQRRKHERAMRQTVQALVRAIELRDPYLAGHSQRVEHLCAAIADRLGLAEHDRATLILAACLSQIGKLFIPAKILRKPGRHTAAETQIMQAHIDHALRVLREVDFELPVAEVLYQMHERLDGSGYPRGLKGGEIDLLPRILGTVDVFCARTAPRSYRDRIGHYEALRLLTENPTRYDTQLVEALAAVAAAEPEENLRSSDPEPREFVAAK